MKSPFPVVGILGAGHLSKMLVAPAIALGIDLKFFAGDATDVVAVREFAQDCDLLSYEYGAVPISVIRAIEAEGAPIRPSSATLMKISDLAQIKAPVPEGVIAVSVLVARSPHAQASVWTPTQIYRKEGVWTRTETPVIGISKEFINQAQNKALEIALALSLTGVMSVELYFHDGEFKLCGALMTPHSSGYWTMEGSRTDQFEQHLRAILDLPLGDTSMTSGFVVVGNVMAGTKADMYRPYLHLMARSPAMKFHQYGVNFIPGREVAHVSAFGDDLLDLRECITHAVDYMSGEIDE